MRLPFLFLIALLVSGCASGTYGGQFSEAAIAAQSRQYLGGPLTNFIDATGLSPVSAIKVTGGKTFFFEKAGSAYMPPVTPYVGGHYNNPQMAAAMAGIGSSMSTPGHFVPVICSVKVKTTGSGEDLDKYIIQEISWSGGCQ